MARKNVRRESSVGLIVTLIFFILASIGLGAATYYGFQQQDQLTKAAKAADDLRKDADAKAKWYEFHVCCCTGPGWVRPPALTSPSIPRATRR